MGEIRVTTEINLPGNHYTKTVTIETKFREWAKARDDIPKLERQLERIKDTIAEMTLSRDKILSSIAQQTENMDMPRGSDVSDKVGNMVASVVDKIHLLEAECEATLASLRYAKYQIQQMEESVNQLEERYKKLIEMYYLDGYHWARICAELFISKPRMYQMLEMAKDAMGGGMYPIYRY
jgi:DNA-directed RNA polymerase specialized sigma subunit